MQWGIVSFYICWKERHSLASIQAQQLPRVSVMRSRRWREELVDMMGGEASLEETIR